MLKKTLTFKKENWELRDFHATRKSIKKVRGMIKPTISDEDMIDHAALALFAARTNEPGAMKRLKMAAIELAEFVARIESLDESMDESI